MKTFTIRNRQIHLSLGLLNVLFTCHLFTGNFHDADAQVVELSDWILKDNFQYYVSQTSVETSSTWHSARDWCMTNSADLTSISSQEESDFIISQVNLTGYQGSFWTGFNHLQSDTWSWTDGVLVNYTNWEATFPVDNVQMPWKCGYSELTGMWKNAHCDATRGYVCKRPVDVVTTVKIDPPTTPVPGYCPAGYFGVVNSNKCFRIVKLDIHADQGLPWDAAAAACRDEPGISPDLASIANEAENNAILAHMENQTDGVWIGLRREDAVATWKWSDNSPVVFTNWDLPNEPLGSTDHCVEIWFLPGTPGTWNNVLCEGLRSYVCQTYKDPAFIISTPSMTTTSNCPTGYVPYWYGCYKLYTEPKSWSDAKAQCIQDGGHLTSIHSEPENAAMAVYVSNAGSLDLVWIGLEYLANENVYYWSDNWHVIYTNWDVGQPNRTADGGGCVGIVQQGTWRDSICSQPMPFLCKITTAIPNTTPSQKEGTCPKNSSSFNWFPYGDYCYGLSSYTYVTNTWDYAQQACVNAAPGKLSNLVSIHNSLEGRFAGELVLRYISTTYDSFWIGLRKDSRNTSFKWIDNTEVEYTYWNPGEPNDIDGTQLCGRQYHKNFANTWDDYPCSNWLPFLCKVLKSPYPTTPPTPPNVDGMCPSEEWVSYGGDCYLFRPDLYVTWDEADQDCKAFGSSLVTILNKDDNWFVHHRLLEYSWLPFVRQFWIGLSKQQNDNRYLWSDGLSLETTNYTNWMTGNPIDDSSRLCVDMYGSNEEDLANSAKWMTTQCDQLRGYACRVSKAAVTPPNPGSDSGGPDAGAIVGAVFGIIIGVGLIAGGSYFGYRWYKGRQTNTPTGAGVSNVSYDNSSQNGSSKGTSHSDGEPANYFGDLDSQDLASVRIGRLELSE